MTNPRCTACISTLDPLSWLFFGFWALDLYDPLELSRYHPEREPLGAPYLGVEPEWFGIPVQSLADLATVVPEDARFPICAADTFSSALWRRPITEATRKRLRSCRSSRPATDASGPCFSHTHRASATSPLRRPPTVGPVWSGPSSRDHPGDPRLRLDYRGENRFPTMRDRTPGRPWWSTAKRSRAPSRPPTPTHTTWRAAQAAARHALTSPLENAPAGRTTTTSADDPAFAPAVRHAWRWLTATEPTTDDLGALAVLWHTAGSGDPREGWVAVVTALLQDPLVVTY